MVSFSKRTCFSWEDLQIMKGLTSAPLRDCTQGIPIWTLTGSDFLPWEYCLEIMVSWLGKVFLSNDWTLNGWRMDWCTTRPEPTDRAMVGGWFGRTGTVLATAREQYLGDRFLFGMSPGHWSMLWHFTLQQIIAAAFGEFQSPCCLVQSLWVILLGTSFWDYLRSKKWEVHLVPASIVEEFPSLAHTILNSSWLTMTPISAIDIHMLFPFVFPFSHNSQDTINLSFCSTSNLTNPWLSQRFLSNPQPASRKNPSTLPCSGHRAEFFWGLAGDASRLIPSSLLWCACGKRWAAASNMGALEVEVWGNFCEVGGPLGIFFTVGKIWSDDFSGGIS